MTFLRTLIRAIDYYRSWLRFGSRRNHALWAWRMARAHNRRPNDLPF